MYGRQPAVIIKLQEKGRQELQRLLNSMFANADDSLFELAGNAPTNSGQNLYFESMRAIRQHRRKIEKHFFVAMRDGFRSLLKNNHLPQSVDKSSVSLVDNGDIDEVVALEGMISAALEKHAEELGGLTRRIAGQLVSKKLSLDENPLAPKRVCETFVEACRDLSIDRKSKLLFFKLFDKEVVGNFGDFYRMCNQLFRESHEPIVEGNLENLSLPAPVENKQVRLELELKRESEPKLEQKKSKVLEPELSVEQEFSPQVIDRDIDERLIPELVDEVLIAGVDTEKSAFVKNTLLLPSGNAPAMSRALLLDLLDAVQQKDKTIVAQGGLGFSFVQTIMLRLEEVLREKNVQQCQCIPMLDEERIALVGLLFTSLNEDNQTPDSIKSLLLGLHVPIVKLVLLEPDFFEKTSHSARRLLNGIISSTVGWNEPKDKSADAYYLQVKTIVTRVLDSYKREASVFEEVFSEFLTFVTADRKRALLVEHRTVTAEDGRAKSERAREKVRAVLKDILSVETTVGEKIPRCVRTLLNQPWNDVLFLILMKEGSESNNWRKALRTAEYLVWSVRPLGNEDDRARWKKRVPALLKNLQKGTKQIRYNETEMLKLLSDLEKTLRTVIDAYDKPRIDGFRHASAAKRRASHVSASNSEKSPLQNLEKEKLPNPTVEDEKKKEPEDPFLLQAKSLKIGAWIEISEQQGITFRCRLASVINELDRYIFVNRAGMKVAEKHISELAEDLSEGKALVLKDGQLFDRALQSVIGDLRERRQEQSV